MRSIPLAEFAPLGKLKGLNLFSLQKGFGAEQIDQLAGTLDIISLGDQLDETSGPFMDTAAVLRNLDLVITADTSIAHIAGALGVPTWLALAHVPDWRWLLEREDSPWYPTVRLFRQTSAGDWSSVVRQMADELLQLSVPDINPSFAGDKWLQYFAGLRRCGSLKYESEQRTKGGRLIPVEIVANHVQFGAVERSAFPTLYASFNGRIGVPVVAFEFLALLLTLVLYGLRPAETPDDWDFDDLDLTEDRVHLGTGGAAIRIIDLETGAYRPTTLKDLYLLARLVDKLDHVHFFLRPCIPTDIAGDAYDVNMFYACMKGTGKHVMSGVNNIEGFHKVLDLASMVAGGREKLCEKPFISIITSFAISPLKLCTASTLIMQEANRHRIPVALSCAPMAGSTSLISVPPLLPPSISSTAVSVLSSPNRGMMITTSCSHNGRSTSLAERHCWEVILRK
jgi:hypothetical protein